MTKRRILP